MPDSDEEEFVDPKKPSNQLETDRKEGSEAPTVTQSINQNPLLGAETESPSVRESMADGQGIAENKDLNETARTKSKTFRAKFTGGEIVVLKNRHGEK